MADQNGTTIRDIAAALEAWAPGASAQSYDNVGLQIGNAERGVEAALIALDLTPAVVAEARETGASLVVTHHPLLFRPLKRVTADDPRGALVLQLAASGIALYSAHTNLDAAPGGVSFALGEQIGLEEQRFLRPLDESLYKLVTFIPSAHASDVRKALADAGAGRIGDYEGCAFESSGTGHFRPGAGTNPFIGSPGEEESAAEVRLEVEVARWDLERVLGALRSAHPYEEVAYDVYPVEQPSTRAGMGTVGTLPSPEPLSRFLARVAERLEAGSLRYAGNPEAVVERVAVCGGSGSDLTPDALRSGADAFVTADITYHRYFDVLRTDGSPVMALIDAGHYETEAVTERLLEKWLSDRFPSVRWQRTAQRTSPVRSFVSP